MELKTELKDVYRQESGALINKNNSALIEYKRKKQEMHKIKTLENNILLLTQEVDNLKKIVEKISINSKV